jgi:uncharacterized membrane protein
MLSFARKLPAPVVFRLEAWASAFREQGRAALAWTLGLGVALAAGAAVLFGPSGAYPRPFSLIEHPVWLAVLCSLAVAAVASGITALRRRKDSRAPGTVYAENLRRVAPLLALPMLLLLHLPFESVHSGLVLAVAAIAGVLTVYAAYSFTTEREASESAVWPRAAAAVLGLFMVAYALTASRVTIANHLNLNTGRSDLGYYLSIFRQSSQGKLLGCSLCGGGSHLTGHFDPILVPLSPLFLLYPFAETLLVLQTLWLTSGAIPVYLLARHHVRHRGAAVALAVAYLAYPALHGVNFFDFHSVALCIPLFLWLLYCLERGFRAGYYVSLALLLLVREDIPIALVCVGAFAIFSRIEGRVRMGWITILLSVVYFVTVKAALMGRVDPLNTSTGASGGYAYYYEAMIPPGYSTAALVGTLISNPVFVLSQIFTDDKVDFLLKLLVPLFALPVLARGRIMLAYGSALTLLASRPYLFSIHFQYTSLLIPFLFVLCASALGRLATGEVSFQNVSGPRLARALCFGILVTTVVCSWKFGALIDNASFQGGFRPLYRDVTPEHRALAAWLKKIALTIPRGSRVAGNSRLITHLGPVTNLDLLDNRAKADYLVVNIAARPLGPRVLQEEAAGNLTLIESHEAVRFYKAHYKGRATTPAGAGEPSEQ